MDQPVIGAHTGGFNTDTVGVAALGDYETNAVPSAVVAAFGRILGWKLGLYGRDPYGRTTLTSGGATTTGTRLVRWWSSTSSPATAMPPTPHRAGPCPRHPQDQRPWARRRALVQGRGDGRVRRGADDRGGSRRPQRHRHPHDDDSGSLVAFPAGTTRPTAADLSYSGNQIVSNLVVVRLSATGASSLANLGSDAANALIDVDGFYTMGG